MTHRRRRTAAALAIALALASRGCLTAAATTGPLPDGLVRLTVYRTAALPFNAELANTNAADVLGEIDFLESDCVRRAARSRRDGPAPGGAYAPCDGSDAMTRFDVVTNASFSCYIMMNYALGGCSGTLSSGDPGCPSSVDWSNCTDVLGATGGLVGRHRGLGGLGATESDLGWWYSFQALSECAEGDEIGDGGCTWRVERESVRSVAVCCVNLANATTFLETFDACPEVNASDAAALAASYACPTTVTTTATTTATVTTDAPTTSRAPAPSSTTTAATTDALTSLTSRAPTPSPTRPPSSVTANAGGAGSSPRVRLSAGDDVGLAVGAVVVIAVAGLAAAFVCGATVRQRGSARASSGGVYGAPYMPHKPPVEYNDTYDQELMYALAE